MAYDARNEAVLVRNLGDSGFNVTKAEYDPYGRIHRLWRPYAENLIGAEETLPHATYSYDNDGRLSLATFPRGGASWQYELNKTRHFLNKTDDGMQKQEDDVDVDFLGRTIRHTETLAATASYPTHDVVTRYGYGPFSALRDVVDTSSNVVHMDYDVRGRRLAISDPDSGIQTETHDAFDELATEKTDGRLVTFHYDLLGRPRSEETTEGTNVFTWDVAPNGIGRIASTASQDGVDVSYEYNPRRRLSAESWRVAGSSEVRVDYGYNDFGDSGSIQYPDTGGGRYGVAFNYAPNGDLGSITIGSQGEFWRVDARSADRSILQETTGDGFVAARAYEPERGMLTSRWLTSTQGGSQTLVDTLTQHYEARGYLDSRSHLRPANGTTAQEENFSHDELGRLTNWSSDSWTGRYDYDDIGNMRVRELTSSTSHDLKNFTSGGSAGPHAVTSVTVNGVSESYHYDPAGRQISGPDRTIGYTDFDLPRTVTKSGITSTFEYSADHQRTVKQSSTGTTIYVGSLYEKRTVGGQTTHVMYVPGESGVVAQITQIERVTSPTVEYFHSDQLGSIDEVTSDPSGTVSAVVFEPFGARLAPTSIASFPMSVPPPLPSVTRGFTGHEHDDELGLINMAGRVYDPRLARFLTPDPVVSHPDESQAFNPYSYVENSPLRYVDPTGFAGKNYVIPPLKNAPKGTTAAGGVPGRPPAPPPKTPAPKPADPKPSGTQGSEKITDELRAGARPGGSSNPKHDPPGGGGGPPLHGQRGNFGGTGNRASIREQDTADRIRPQNIIRGPEAVPRRILRRPVDFGATAPTSISGQDSRLTMGPSWGRS